MKMISAEEEVLLAQRIRNGDNDAIELLVQANLRFVVSVAKQYQNHGLTLNDLISEGNVGLIKAATRFDERRGFKFISYAVWWIRQTISAAIAGHARVVRLPSNQISSLRSMKKGRAQLEQELEREPTSAELAEVMEVDQSRIDHLRSISEFPRSFDAPAKVDSMLTLVDVFVDDEQDRPDQSVDKESINVDVQRVLQTLTERDRGIVCAFYGIGAEGAKTLDEIGFIFGLTRERVRQIKENAIRKLRSQSTYQLLQNQ